MGRQVEEKARELGMEIQLLREKHEEEVKRGEVETLGGVLQSGVDILKRISAEELVGLVREDRERWPN